MKIEHLNTIENYWNEHSMEYCQSHPEHLVPEMHPSWGLAHIPESELGLLPPRINEEVSRGFRMWAGHDTKGFAEMGYRGTRGRSI